ncbi:MAG: glycosyltransferase [Candidatus Electrothrix sp. AW2]|nr:glycosyltransferase [Candidatus Electrothrix gigas]
MVSKPTSVCYILSYYFPTYVRTHSLLSALKGMENINVSKAVNRNNGIARYVETLYKLIRIRLRENPDIYILGFRGYELFWPVRLITFGKKLIFDHMMSPYDSLLYEKKRIRPGSVLAKVVHQYEKSVLTFSDVVLTDTNLHKKYFAELFRLDPEKIFPIHISTDENLFKRSEPRIPDDRFNVFYYGSFLPLHGINVVLEAAEMLNHEESIRFTFIGGGERMKRLFENRGNKAGNIHYKNWVDYHLLPDWINQADLCLGGPFGSTGQACRVITGKTFQFLAMGKPTVIGKIDEPVGFFHRRNCILVEQENGQQLADAILWAHENRRRLNEIGREGYRLYQDQFSNRCIAERLKDVFI